MVLPQVPHPVPALHGDGTATVVVHAPAQLAPGALVLTLAVPRRFGPEQPAGHFLLARCGAQTPQQRDEQWTIYLRRPLFAAATARPLPGSDQVAVCQVSARFAPGANPAADPDPGYAWLAQLDPGQPINVTGWFGGGFAVAPLTRRLLLVADAGRIWSLLPLIDAMLDRGGQVSIVLLPGPGPAAPDATAWRTRLPLAVELHVPESGRETDELASAIPWADQVCLAVSAPGLPPIADIVRRKRLRLEPGFALALVDADLACGTGACLACVTPLANGSLTRACVHGPVFDLVELAGRR